MDHGLKRQKMIFLVKYLNLVRSAADCKQKSILKNEVMNGFIFNSFVLF